MRVKKKALALVFSALLILLPLYGEISENAVNADADKQCTRLVPCGNTIGIKIEADGVAVVGTMGIAGKGEAVGKLQKGDVITKVDGKTVNSTEELKAALRECDSPSVLFDVLRSGENITLEITPTVNPLDGSRLIGAWVRDSAAGIGTMTWYDPESGRYGALGHGITDVDTGERYGVSRGEIVQVSVTGAEKGRVGEPGIISGEFLDYEGTVDTNSDSGIGGYVENSWMLPEREALEVALPKEVSKGNAEMLCCIDGVNVESFSVEIERVMNNRIFGNKNLVVHVTDDRILEKTGGIVQGMSGSPILQNGKLVGAVTHVCVNL